MKAKDLFNLAVRLFGLLFLYLGLLAVPSAIATILGYRRFAEAPLREKWRGIDRGPIGALPGES